MIIFKGKVKQGEKRGKNLGFPTANISIHKQVEEGIYVSKIKITNKSYNALTFIGKAVTFNENKLQAETYILDFNENIYNSWVSIKLLKKIRGNKKFNNVKDLIQEMKNDEAKAREFLKIKAKF